MKISYEQPKNGPGWHPLGSWIRRLIPVWLTAAALEVCLLPAELRDLAGLEGLARMSGGWMTAVTAVLFLLLSGLSRLWDTRKLERWLAVAAFGVLAAVTLAASFAWAYLAVCLLVLGCLTAYAIRGWDGSRRKLSRPGAESPAFAWITAFLALLFFLLVSAWTVCRVYSFSTPSFDFSIFAQMFHSMRTTGLPVTTIERDGPLSHFAVHVSPIYYLLLPFYCLYPRPETLQVLQAAVLASGVIPLWKLGKVHGLNPMLRGLLSLGLLLYPAYAGGASYDIHENAFLTPLMLWLFYGMDRKNGPVTAVFAILTLTVKEDAAVYVAVAALYLILRSCLKGEKWGLWAGSAMLAGAVVYFLLVTGYLAQKGDGVMTYRYRNFMYDGSDSLVTVIKAVLLNPMKAVYESVDAEKLPFIGLTLLPLAGLPLMTRRYERLLLLIPYVLVNLMSDYQYQHDIFFQYTYGSTACLFYLTLSNLADLKRGKMALLTAALCISALCFGGKVLPKAVAYPGYCAAYAGYYSDLRQTLDVIPEDASVAATTFYTTYLSQRDVLYDVRYASQEHLLQCEYVALNVKDEKSFQKYGGYGELVNLLRRNGYQLVEAYGEKLEVYHRP